MWLSAQRWTGLIEEVRKELVRRNPRFDGKMEHKIEDGAVTDAWP
jgi:hypothetical protein